MFDIRVAVEKDGRTRNVPSLTQQLLEVQDFEAYELYQE